MKFFLALIFTAIISIGIGYAIVKYPEFFPQNQKQQVVTQNKTSLQVSQTPTLTPTPTPTYPPLDDSSNLTDEIKKIDPPDTKEDFKQLDSQLQNF